MRLTVFWMLLLTVTSVRSQDFEIATVMHYNLLNYRNTTSFCTGSNNSAIAKEGYLETILKDVDPDIFTANEIGNNVVNADRILSRCLNTDGVTKYAQAQFTATSGSSLTNMLYYNTEMFTLVSQDQIEEDLNGTQLVRLIDVYTLYYNDPNLNLSYDTNYLTVFTAHLKAGNTTSDRNQRARATAALMDYIETNQLNGNVLFTGDFNTYDGGDEPFQNLVDHSNSAFNFKDPINAIGDWNNNSTFRFEHTQSTRLNNTNGACFSGGGSDDRFDFILINESIKEDLIRMEYINNSYRAMGQDGNRFNSDLINPANTSESQDVITALYEMSDHLPVILDLKMTFSEPSSTFEFKSNAGIKAFFSANEITISNPGNRMVNSVTLTDLNGRQVHQFRVGTTSELIRETTEFLETGWYLISIETARGETINLKGFKY